MNENDPVALSELAGVLDIVEADLRNVTTDTPFAPDLPGECLRLSVAFGAAVLISLARSEALPTELACRVAIEAANGATIGGTISLLVAWRDATPSWCWYEGEPVPPPIHAMEGFGSPLRRPMMLIPACAMLSDLADAISARRERSAGVTAH